MWAEVANEGFPHKPVAMDLEVEESVQELVVGFSLRRLRVLERLWPYQKEYGFYTRDI